MLSKADALCDHRPENLPRAIPAALTPAPSRADKLRRALWWAVQATLYRMVPTPFHGVRCALLRLFGATVEAGAFPYPAATVWAPWNLTMHRGSCMGNYVDVYNVADVVLEAGCVVSQKAYLCTAGHDFRSPTFPLTAAPIRISPRAWVAADAFIGPGVTLGEGAVVGARAVVTRSVPAGIVVAGNPARILGTRTERFREQ